MGDNIKETADSNLEATQEELKEQHENQDVSEASASEADLHTLLEEKIKEVDNKNKECEEALGRLQRLQADFENFKKRTAKEKEEFYKYASEKLITELLPVLDNFERALATEGETADLKTGVEMIFKQLQDVLAREGLSVIEAVGSEFDPNQHQAIMQVESEEYGENIVAEEFQKGYRLKDKVIRHSMVKVAK